MERKEAIEELKAILEMDYKNVPLSKAALDMAIKALEQEPIIDRIRAQIKDYLKGVEITLDVLVENDPLILKMEGAKVSLEACLNIIDEADRSEEDGKEDR